MPSRSKADRAPNFFKQNKRVKAETTQTYVIRLLPLSSQSKVIFYKKHRKDVHKTSPFEVATMKCYESKILLNFG